MLPPTWLPEWVQFILLVVGALSAIAAAILLPIHWNRLAGDAAQVRHERLQARTIETLQSEVVSVRRQLDMHISNVEQCEKRLRATEEALAKWDNLLGSIWVNEFGEKP